MLEIVKVMERTPELLGDDVGEFVVIVDKYDAMIPEGFIREKRVQFRQSVVTELSDYRNKP